MAITLSVRGTGTQAYYSLGMGVPKVFGTVSVDAGAGTGIIGNSVINLDQGSFGQRALLYPGYMNIPTTQTISILMRCAFGDTSNALNMLSVGGLANDSLNQARASGAGTIAYAFSQKDTGASLVAPNPAVTYTTATYYDFVWLINGTLTTGAVKFYQDNSLILTSAFSSTRAALTSTVGMMIALGMQNANTQTQTRIKVNEFVLFDTIIDPSSVACGGSNVALNGASRSAFVDTPAQSNGSDGPSRRIVRYA